jgi:hypothetical protein
MTDVIKHLLQVISFTAAAASGKSSEQFNKQQLQPAKCSKRNCS